MFSYECYQSMIQRIQKCGKTENFYTARGKDAFIIMRHDVEFSVERAYHLALVEAEESFHSTYFFQLTNNAYNLLSQHNIMLINEIARLGHQVGLHFYPSDQTNLVLTRMELKKQIAIMNELFPFKVDTFSIHHPSKALLKANFVFPELINTYQKDYFSSFQDIASDTPKICYLSDAKHHWNCGLIPSEDFFRSHAKIQILTHPYSWTQRGYDTLHNFRSLIAEHTKYYIETIDSECAHFQEVKDAL